MISETKIIICLALSFSYEISFLLQITGLGVLGIGGYGLYEVITLEFSKFARFLPIALIVLGVCIALVSLIGFLGAVLKKAAALRLVSSPFGKLILLRKCYSMLQ